MKSKKRTKNKWFIAVRGSYLPNNASGWLSYVPFVVYLVVAALVAKSVHASTITKLYFVFIEWSFAGLAMTWLARRKS